MNGTQTRALGAGGLTSAQEAAIASGIFRPWSSV